MRNLVIIFALLCSVLAISVNAKSDRPSFHERHAYEMHWQEMRHRSHPAKKLDNTNVVHPKAFPCPEAPDIAPCVCVEVGADLYLDCTDVESDEQLEQIFQADFPVKFFYEFQVHRSDSLVNLNFTTNGVSFEHFYFAVGPFAIETVTEDLFTDSALVVETIGFEYSRITDGNFPFDSLSNYPSLYFLDLYGGELTTVPRIVSFSLTGLVLGRNRITAVEPGAFDGIPNVNEYIFQNNELTTVAAGTFQYVPTITTIDLSNNLIQTIESGAFFDSTPDGTGILTLLLLEGNQLTELGPNTIPITAGARILEFASNSISTIDPTAFFIHSEPALDTVVIDFSNNQLTTIDQAVFGPIMPYVSELFLVGNPLACGCDVAWLLNSVSLDKISDSTTCADGTPVNQLNPVDFLNC